MLYFPRGHRVCRHGLYWSIMLVITNGKNVRSNTSWRLPGAKQWENYNCSARHLRLTVSQSVRLGVEPLLGHNQISVSLLDMCGLCHRRAPCLTRGCVCDLLGSRSICGEPGSSVSIVSGYGLDDRAIEVRFPAEAKDFSSNLCVQTGSEPHPASRPMGAGGPFPGAKSRPGRDAYHSPPSNAEVENE
jgi:hypothetical protein